MKNLVLSSQTVSTWAELPECLSLWVPAHVLVAYQKLDGAQAKKMLETVAVITSSAFSIGASIDYDWALTEQAALSLHGECAVLVETKSKTDVLQLTQMEVQSWSLEASCVQPIEFIDLKTQQTVAKNQIEKRISTVLRHGQYIMGPEVVELELALAEYVGVPYAIGVSNGTDALVIALMALGVGPGDEVVTTAFTFVATAEAILMVGACPVYADVNEKTYNIDEARIEEVITKKTKAIISVSLYGQCANLDAISQVAENHNLPIIEDAAQSFGSTHNGRRSCSLTTIACTSFFPSKPLGGYGDGGMCFTSNLELAQKMKSIRVHGQEKRYYHTILGMNARLDTLQAAILLEKFKLFPSEVSKRQHIAEQYNARFRTIGLEPYILPGNTSVYAQYTLAINNRSAVIEELNRKGIPSAVHYPYLLSDQPAFIDERCDLPNASTLCEKVLSLPMSPYLTKEQVDYIAENVLLALNTASI